MVEAWLGRLPGVASAHQGTIKSQQLPNVQPRPSAHGERVHGAHSRTESIAETLGKTAGVPPVDPILLPHLSYPLPPPIPPNFPSCGQSPSWCPPRWSKPLSLHFPLPDPGPAREKFSCLANKIKTYLPLTVSTRSTDLLLLLGCYKTDALAATLISIHLLSARE